MTRNRPCLTHTVSYSEWFRLFQPTSPPPSTGRNQRSATFQPTTRTERGDPNASHPSGTLASRLRSTCFKRQHDPNGSRLLVDDAWKLAMFQPMTRSERIASCCYRIDRQLPISTDDANRTARVSGEQRVCCEAVSFQPTTRPERLASVEPSMAETADIKFQPTTRPERLASVYEALAALVEATFQPTTRPERLAS